MDSIVYFTYHHFYEINQLPQLLVSFNRNYEINVLTVLGLPEKPKGNQFSYHLQSGFGFIFYLSILLKKFHWQYGHSRQI